MFINYIKTAARSLKKNRIYTTINILGLMIGIAAIILILCYIRYETSFDKFHVNGDNIYRISVKTKWEGRDEIESPFFVAAMGPAILRDFPGIKNFMRLRTPQSSYFFVNENPINLDNIRYVDPSIFEMFSFELVIGNRKTALEAPYAIVLTESLARQFFNDEEPIGRVIKSSSGDVFTVTGIVRDCPKNSTIQFNALISFSTLYTQSQMYMDWDGGNQYITYVELFTNSDPDELSNRLPVFVESYLGKNPSLQYSPYLQPLLKLHLYYEPGVLNAIITFTSIAFVILLLACINFINLYTALSLNRIKEIGIRKVIGAERRNLIIQFLTESMISALIATVLALIIVLSVLPLYQSFVGIDINSITFGKLNTFVLILTMIILVGVMSGGYPAFYLSSLVPVKILKNVIFSGNNKYRFRNYLIIFQFTICIVLIIAALMIHQQLHFIQNKTLGYSKENLLVISLTITDMRTKSDIIKNELLKNPAIQSACLSSQVPHRGFEANGYLAEGANTRNLFHVVFADQDFLKTYNIHLNKGRNFSNDYFTDKECYLVNQTLVNTIGWKNPIDKYIERNGKHKVIGVVDDFHYATLHDKIEPLIIARTSEYGSFNHLTLLTNSDNYQKLISFIKTTISGIVPSAPFNYWFLDDAFDSLYKSEEKLKQLILLFSTLAIFIAIIGLFGLVSFVAGKRTKEIGIRKVLGATVFEITNMISIEFVIIVFIANLLAFPVSWYIMRQWLQQFAYRISITIWPFLLAGLITLMIVLLTVSWQAIRAARANPVKSLQYE